MASDQNPTCERPRASRRSIGREEFAQFLDRALAGCAGCEALVAERLPPERFASPAERLAAVAELFYRGAGRLAADGALVWREEPEHDMACYQAALGMIAAAAVRPRARGPGSRP